MYTHLRLYISYHKLDAQFMPRLHLPYDEYTMPVRCPNHCFRAASAGRLCDHRTDLRASWPLWFCFTPHNEKIWKKNRKPVACRQSAVTPYEPRGGTARWSWGQRTILDCHCRPKMIVNSCDSRREPARSPHDALSGPVKP